MDSCFEEKRVRQDGTGCRMVAEWLPKLPKCLQFPMAESLGIWHLALGTDKEFSKTASFAVLPTEEIRSVE